MVPHGRRRPRGQPVGAETMLTPPPWGARTRATVAIGELADLPVVANADAPPVWSHFWQVDPRPDGSPAPQGPLVHNLDEDFEAIALGACCGFFPESMLPAVRARPDLGHARVTDIDDGEPGLVVRAGDPALPGLSALIDAATREST